MTPVGANVFSARIEVPAGEWLVWPDQHKAVWIGERPDALPAPLRRLDHDAGPPLAQAVDQLASIGVWLREAAVRTSAGWSRSRRLGDVAADLATEQVSAICGIFIDRDGRSARLEVTLSGIWWTNHPRCTIQWLLAIYQLPVPI